MKLCFGRDMNCTDGTKETEALIDSMTSLSRRFSLIKHFPALGTTLQSSPYLLNSYFQDSLHSERLVPVLLQGKQISANDMVSEECANWVNEVRERHQSGNFGDESGRKTVFDAILAAEPHRTTKGLVDEAFSLVIGGTETTVTTITYAVWCILRNPQVEQKMLDELSNVETNGEGLMEYRDLATLPYLVSQSFPLLSICQTHFVLERSSQRDATYFIASTRYSDTSCSTRRHQVRAIFPAGRCK